MKGIAVIMHNRVEIIDITMKGDAVFADHCPGDLAIPCTACDHAVGVRSPQVQHERPSHTPQKPGKRIIFFATCRWFDRPPDATVRSDREDAADDPIVSPVPVPF